MDDVARWKWAKLVTNLSNSIEAICSPRGRLGRLTKLGRDEAAAVAISPSRTSVDHAQA